MRLAALLLLAVWTAPARAQDAGVPAPVVRWERPPAGTLDRGALSVPAWTVIGVGCVVVLGAGVALVAAIRRARRAR